LGKVVTADGLTEKERKFVESFAMGMTQSQAAKAAGYGDPYVRSHEMMRNPRILAAIDAYRARNAEAAMISRKDVLDGMTEAIDMARTLQDPVAMIAGWREIAKVCGHYEPTTKRVDISINGQMTINRLAELPDHELAKLIEGEVIEVSEDDS
jgi:phage terminase small subunit